MATNVAILGLGTMGSGMAGNLLKAGFPLTVYNRTFEKARPLVQKGAKLAATPADAAKDASFVIGMLADDGASREVWTAKDGGLNSVGRGTLVIECSTVSPEWVAELAKLAAERGADFLDAPVTGSKMQAEGGQLSFLVGGSEKTLASATPVLRA